MRLSRDLPRAASTIAISLSETSTRQSSSNNRSAPQTIALPPQARKQSSSMRFSCYLKSHHAHKNQAKLPTKKLPSTVPSRLPKNNNHFHDPSRSLTACKRIIRLDDQSRTKLCSACLKLVQMSVTHLSSKSLCHSCLDSIRKSNQMATNRKVGLTKSEEHELRQIIEVILEEFQDHFRQAMNLSIKQMTQHLLSNINLFYDHYQQEFEQLTKNYRGAFLDRFRQLMGECQTSPTGAHHATHQIKPSLSYRVMPLVSSSHSASVACFGISLVFCCMLMRGAVL